MPEGRCDLILLLWTAFVCFNLISDVLWSGGSESGGDASGGSGGRPGASQEMYRGQYWLRRRNSTMEEGVVRITLASQLTPVRSVQVSSLDFALVPKGASGGFSSRDSGLLFSAVEFGKIGEKRHLAAQGISSRLSQQFGPTACQLNAAIELVGTNRVIAREGMAQPEEMPDEDDVEVSGEIAAMDCGVNLHFMAKKVSILGFTQKVAHYSIWVNFLTILQIRLFLSQMRHTEDGPLVGKVSIACIGMQALMDAYDSFLHLCLGLSSQYMFNTVAVVSLFKFILFSLLEARYVLSIWRQRNQEAFNQGWEVMRRELWKLNSRFYSLLVVGLVLIYNSLDRLDSIVLLFQLYWVPQIVHDAWMGSRNSLSQSFICGISLTRTLLIVYLWGCPSSIFNGDLYPQLPNAPSTSVCVTAVLLQGSQVLFMLSQKKLGPRWFVPWVCMPWAYNYHRRVQLEAGTDCVICMAELDPEDARRVVTPCSHQFHRVCLEQWMDVKMECPTCRAILPPMQ